MTLRPKHQTAIDLLVASRFEKKTQQQIASELGIARRTLRYWLDAPEFAQALDAATEQANSYLDDLQFRHRRERVKELQRLYQTIPDDCPDKVVKVNGEAILVNKSNADVKAKLLDQICAEVGDKQAVKIEATGENGGPVEARVTVLHEIEQFPAQRQATAVQGLFALLGVATATDKEE